MGEYYGYTIEELLDMSKEELVMTMAKREVTAIAYAEKVDALKAIARDLLK